VKSLKGRRTATDEIEPSTAAIVRSHPAPSMSASALARTARTARTAATHLKTGIRSYKNASEYISVPLAFMCGVGGAASGYDYARREGHGALRATACAVAHVPFYAFLGYGLGPIVIPAVTAIGVGTLAGVATFEYGPIQDDDGNETEKKQVRFEECSTKVKFSREKLPAKETEVE
jgi:hypothetical protein